MLAALSTPNYLDWTSWLQFGVLGIVAIGFVLGKIVPGYILDRIQKELDSKNAEMAQLRSKMENEVIPALTRVTDLMTRIAESSLQPQRPLRAKDR